MVGGDWIASSMAAGIKDGGNGFGDGNDQLITGPGTTDVPTRISRIASVSIGGMIFGSSTAFDHFGFVAQQIGSFRRGGELVPLTAGLDIVELSPYSTDVKIREL
jgi:hypothetical protein